MQQETDTKQQRPVYSLPDDPDKALERSHELQRNPPLPAAGGRLQATLSVLVNNTPCDSVYISEAAVALHHLHVPPGWYVEVPDHSGEDQPLSVRLKVEPPSPRDFPLCCVVFVDGHLSSRIMVRTSEPVEVKGCVSLQEDGSAGTLQPFLLRKASSRGDCETPSEDEVAEDHRSGISHDVRGPVGSIHFYVLPAVIGPRCRPGSSGTTAEARAAAGARDKKEAMGATELEVALGSAVGDNGWVPSLYRPSGPILAQVKLRYRKRKFFANLQSLITATTGSGGAAAGPHQATDQEDNNKNTIKPEPHATLDSEASVKTFISRLARKENMEPGSLGRLLAELRRLGMAQVAHLAGLTRPQWCEIVRSVGLPACFAKSALQLVHRALTPPHQPTDCITIE